MKYEIVVTDDAAADLIELDDYIANNDSIENAEYVLDNLEKTIQGLQQLPNRGNYPAELLSLGIEEYREIRWTVYRVVYRVSTDLVYVYVVADTRRDLQELLHRRLLRS